MITEVRDGTRFTDSDELRPDSDPSGAFFGIMKSNTKKNCSYLQRCKKTNKKRERRGFYEVDEILRVDE